MSLLEAIKLEAYPKSVDCGDGHIGETELVFYRELDDDRYNVLVIGRCGHCDMPNGKDDYANEINTERFYAGLEPVAQ